MLGRVRLVLWILVALAAIAGLWIYSQQGPRNSETPMVADQVGGEFTLIASDGTEFSSKRLAGRPHAVFFGFTHCPDVCPMTLARLVKLRRQLDMGDDAFDIVLISVDPDRDTPEALAKYVELFDSPIIALTGSTSEIEKVKDAYNIFSEKVPLEGDNYTVDHTASVLLFDADGELAGTIALEEGDPPALEKLRNIASN